MLFDFFLQNHWFEVLDVVSLVEVRRSGEVTEEIVHQVELLSFSGLAVDEVGTTFSWLVCSDIPIVTIGEDTLRYIEIDVDRLVVWVGESMAKRLQAGFRCCCTSKACRLPCGRNQTHIRFGKRRSVRRSSVRSYSWKQIVCLTISPSMSMQKASGSASENDIWTMESVPSSLSLILGFWTRPLSGMSFIHFPS